MTEKSSCEISSPDGLYQSSAPPRSSLTLDVELYETYLKDNNLTAEQKRKFLETLWTIIVSFVDLGFEVDPLQQMPSACGQNGKNHAPPAIDTDDLLKSEAKELEVEDMAQFERSIK